MPKISVIVPVYKVEDLLCRCVDSILNQSFTDFELILVDDGSPDRSGEICDAYAARDGRVRVLHQKNSGVSAARNQGLRMADGIFITFIDSDDAVLPGYLEHLLQAQVQSSADVVIAGFLRCIGTQEHPVGSVAGIVCTDTVAAQTELLTCALQQGLLNPCWGKLYRADAIRGCEFPREICWGEDTVFVLRCLSRASRLCFVPLREYRYRHSNEGLDRRFNMEKPRFMLRYYAELFAFTEQMLPDSAAWQRAMDIKVSQEILRTIFALSGQEVTKQQKKQYLKVLFSDKAVNHCFFRGVQIDDNPAVLKLLARFPTASVWLAFLMLRGRK